MTAPTKFKLVILASSFSSVCGGVFPVQTFGHEAELASEPTQAPVASVAELLKRNVTTNYCTDWLFGSSGGFPWCAAPATCVFGDGGDDGFTQFWGCGIPTNTPNQFTACQDYPQSSGAASYIYETTCLATAPICEYRGLALGVGTTYTNWGCGTSSYSTIGTIASTPIGQTATIVNGSLTYAPAPTTSTTSGCLATATDTSQCNPSPTPIGAIVGGVIGGLAFLASIAFLIWYFMRKRRQDRTKDRPSALDKDAATAAAFRNRQSEVSEVEAHPMGDTRKSDPANFASSSAPAYELEGGDGGYIQPSEIGDAAYRPYRPSQ